MSYKMICKHTDECSVGTEKFVCELAEHSLGESRLPAKNNWAKNMDSIPHAIAQSESGAQAINKNASPQEITYPTTKSAFFPVVVNR